MPLLCLLLRALTGAGERAASPELVPLGATAWLAGVQGLAFFRHADYMAGYLWEARGHEVAIYMAWLVAMLGLAWSTLQLPRWSARLLAAVGAGCAVILWPRVTVYGSTLEFREGIARPFAMSPNARALIGLSLIAAVVPVAGVAILLLVRAASVRVRRRAV